jgi:signal transduction histidine kinase
MSDTLLNKYGLNDCQRLERKAYLNITPDDEAAVGELGPYFEEVATALAEGFYRHLLAHEATAKFLRDAELVARLKQLQMDYFHELISGRYDEAYFEKRLRVGEAHQSVGLEPVWYLGAYNQYIQIAFPMFASRLGTQVPERLLALLKVILLDIGLALETYFAAGTAQLRERNADLEQALNLYWQAERKAQQYAKLAGHEIRGSLGAIAAACELVADEYSESLPPAARQTLHDAHARCLKTANVVERILAQPEEAGRPGWVDVTKLLAEVAGRINLYAGEKAIHFERPNEEISVWADGIGLREVFANLIRNAILYSDKPLGTVTVAYEPTSDEHVFCVSDNGPGVPIELHERIFQPFVRGPGEKSGGGRGLGLHFVRTVVTQHGGRVWLTSTPGVGSRFYFSLPKFSPHAGGGP